MNGDNVKELRLWYISNYKSEFKFPIYIVGEGKTKEKIF